MKHRFIISSLVMLSLWSVFGCQGQSKNAAATAQAVDTKKITWNPSFEDALAQAKAQNKLLFVECYSPTCPVCQSIEPLFSNTEVAKRYNTLFINYKLDVGNAEQVKYLNERNIYLPSFPLFLFFDGDGKLVHKDEVEPNAASLLAAAERAVNPQTQGRQLAGRFASGDRTLASLIDYASFARVTKDTTANLQAAAAAFEKFDKGQLGSEESWKITKKIVTDIDNGFAQYWFNNIPKAVALEQKAGHDAGVVNNVMGGIIQASLLSRRGREYGTAKLQTIKGLMNKVGAGQYADSFVWEHETLAHIREGKPAAALGIVSKMAQKYGNSGESLVYLTKVLNDKYPDASYATQARGWLTTAKGLLKEPKSLAEYHLESARLHQRTGNKAAAVADAQAASAQATAAGLPMERFNKLSADLQ